MERDARRVISRRTALGLLAGAIASGISINMVGCNSKEENNTPQSTPEGSALNHGLIETSGHMDAVKSRIEDNLQSFSDRILILAQQGSDLKDSPPLVVGPEFEFEPDLKQFGLDSFSMSGEQSSNNLLFEVHLLPDASPGQKYLQESTPVPAYVYLPERKKLMRCERYVALSVIGTDFVTLRFEFPVKTPAHIKDAKPFIIHLNSYLVSYHGLDLPSVTLPYKLTLSQFRFDNDNTTPQV